ncbi:Tuberculostearic acid methyltransferase UfaA1 [Rubrivivax sp. A210]|uniref:SAM-dependent methyltransferase n=1 Tax=Rubrivivax sp. A210 TaxID=2772301 RepID=UPI0019188EC8|nr:cyclopropane-fatty-acyl-phospholipid synthase family protein [Rubrivivax sp. A210]CAD5367023.1 Tuberculostearic acid methyltransferase UfaA1 [Rubrivivax sp. A210]
MSDPATAFAPAYTRGTPAAAAPSRAERVVTDLLRRMQGDALELRTPARHYHFGHGATPAAVLLVHDEVMFARVLSSGDIGFAEAYIEGQWTTPDLRALLAVVMRQRAVLERAVYGSFWGSLLHRLTHFARRNTRAGSRRNIHAHYDLGNAFYAQWLDETMNYSSAWFDGGATQSLAQAQHRKVARTLDQAGVAAGSRVLEIGCGWGAVAEAAARRGAHLTGVTLSTEQLEWAQARLAKAGLAERADLRLQDYRDLAAEGQRYDAIVSVEMFEAVGRAYWPSYFQTLRDCLAPGGRACVQSIVVRDDLFERYARSTDFIQQYIFPGGMLPSCRVFREQAARAGLVVRHELAFGADYATTLHRWREAFQARQAEIAPLGFDERFMRLWDFYLAYCEAAFETGQTSVVQFTLEHAP